MAEKILVVDDDVDTLRLVGLMLQRQGYQIVAASNGHQALALAQGENPDLILLDIMMPDMDGYEVTRRLRANPATSAIPIIMFTAKSQLDDKVAGFDAGADDYLTKPTQPRELFAHVKAVLARTAKVKPITEPFIKEKGHVIGVLAAKGGLGVTTLALNLAVCLRIRTRKEVILAELRPGQGSLGLELSYLHPEGFNRLLQLPPDEITLTEVESELILHKSEIKLLLSTYHPNDVKNEMQVDRYESIVRQLVYLGDYIILDMGPGLSALNDKMISLCDELIIVLEPVPNTVTRTQLLVDELLNRGFGEGKLDVVLYNRLRSEMMLTMPQVQQQFRHPISVVFTPAPELAYQSSKNNTPLVLLNPDNLVTQQFAKLAEIVSKKTVRVKE